ncbi:MAG: transcriptional repressor [Eubacteriales bacterium]|nr:transcriptional repressor [Eubacteriales bacterium]
MTARKYKTKQYDELLEYLKTIPGEHVTVFQIHEHFQKIGNSIGITTLYRQLDRMIEEGVVKKFTVDPRTPACYEYMGIENEPGEPYYHLRCESCGKLIHIQCAEISELEHHLLKGHGFLVDPGRTVVYGYCEECRRKKAAEKSASGSVQGK